MLWRRHLREISTSTSAWSSRFMKNDSVSADQKFKRTLFGVGDPRDSTHDGEIRKACYTFDEAVKAWEELCDKEPGVHFYITGWNNGTIAHWQEVRDLFA